MTALAHLDDIHDEEQDDLNRRLLFHAMNGDLQDSAIALAEGADPNATNPNGWGPLHLAIVNKNHDIVQLLIENNANVNQADNSGQTPLHLAIMLNSLDILQPLMEAGAVIDLHSERSAIAIQQANTETLEVITAWRKITDLDRKKATSPELMSVFNALSEKAQNALDISNIVSRAHSRTTKLVSCIRNRNTPTP